MCNCKGGVQLGAAPIKLPGFPLWSPEQCSPRYCRKLALTVNYHTAYRLCVSQLLRICLLYWGPKKSTQCIWLHSSESLWFLDRRGRDKTGLLLLSSCLHGKWMIAGGSGGHQLESLKGLVGAWDLELTMALNPCLHPAPQKRCSEEAPCLPSSPSDYWKNGRQGNGTFPRNVCYLQEGGFTQ